MAPGSVGAVEFSAALEHAARLGPIMYLATVTPVGGPHVVPVHLDWHEGLAWCVTGVSDVKTHNVVAHPTVCLHSSVSAETGWDHLMIWGEASLVTDVPTKRRLWSGVFSLRPRRLRAGRAGRLARDGVPPYRPAPGAAAASYGFDGRTSRRPEPLPWAWPSQQAARQPRYAFSGPVAQPGRAADF